MPKICEYKDKKGNKCENKALYGTEGKKPIMCKDKSNNMKYVKGRRYCKCGKGRPYFKLLTETKPMFCSQCKTDEMINVSYRKCNCGSHKRPIFGFPDDEKPNYCTECKKDGMINIVNRRCICNKAIPSFGLLTDEKPTCCKLCKTDDITANKKYNGYCTHCFANLFPNDPKTLQIRKKSKELQVVSFITNYFKGFKHDKPLYVDLDGGCCISKRRVDLRKLIGNTLLCIEIDENQHRGYNKVDEISRYNDLFMDFSGKYIFIRYNPDSYIINGTRRNPQFEIRMKELVKKIKELEKHIKDDKNEELFEIYHMYYDE